MGADLSRIRSNPLRDFAGVELKQGGVVLDADFNEMTAIVDRRLRAAASDILGRSTVSSTTPDAFKITVAGGDLSIGTGRLYVDGMLAESHGAASADPAKTVFDDLLGGVRFADPNTYSAQPWLPLPPALPEAGKHLVYLDVWDREVTNLEDPSLVEVAVGVEASSRRQTVWQVRVLGEDSGSATCGAPDADLAGWPALIAPSSGRLSTGTVDVPPSSDPCELPPTGGYRGFENQTYRVEIHDPGQPGAGATFKWSRENASVGSRVASMIAAGEIELDSLGRDDVLRFDTDDWVEIVDDARELSQRCGEIRKITVNEAARRITFTPALGADMIPAAFPSSDFPRARNLRVRRWDQKHQVLRAGSGGSTTVFQDLDAAGSKGVIAVPAAGTTLILESGVSVSFSSTGSAGFKAGDHWVFAARTADASVEVLDHEPPRGILHHYERLGFWDVAAGTVNDCRHPWPPAAAGGDDCSCSRCVTPESHNSGQFTIQDAVDQLQGTGGTVCLTAGQYELRVPVLLKAAKAVRIRGQGPATLLVTAGGAFDVAGSMAIGIEDVAILSLGNGSAIGVRSVLGLTIQRTIIAVLGSNDANGAGIALAGAVLGTVIRDNVIVAPVAVQALGPGASANGKPPAFLLSALLRIDDNLLWCDRQAVAIAGAALHVLGTRIEGNEIIGCRQGAITALGFCAAGASMRIAGNSIGGSGPGIVAGVSGLWIEGNKLSAAVQGGKATQGDGIALKVGLDPHGIDACQILANQVSGFDAAGISVDVPARDLVVKLNVVSQCGNGIVCVGESRGERVSIENNHVVDIGARAATGEVVGVAVLRAQTAAVSGNTIARVGRLAMSAPLRAGIAVTAAQRARVGANDVTDIAPPASFDVGLGVGVLVRPPFAEVDVNHNQIDRESVPLTQGGGRFMALLVDDPQVDGNSAKLGAYATIRIDAATFLTFGAARPFITRLVALADATGAVAVRGASASVVGNSLASRSDLPAVRVIASGDCLFGDNRAELRGTDGKIAVQLQGSAVIVSANRVRGGAVSMQIRGNGKATTVLGNVTTGIIDLVGGGLPAPWDALNVHG